MVHTFYSKDYLAYLLDWNIYWDDIAQEYSSGDYNDGFLYEISTKITYPKFTSPSENFRISLRYGIWNSNFSTYDHYRLCLINVSVLDAHSWSGASIGLKNWVGVLITAYTNEQCGGFNAMHEYYFFGSYALAAKVIVVTFPKLTIVDAEWTSGSGPNNLYNFANTKVLLGSTYRSAVSWYSAKYVLTPVAIDPADTNPDLDGSIYKNNLDFWTDCLRDYGFACTRDSNEISVYDRNCLSIQSYNIDIQSDWNLVSVPL